MAWRTPSYIISQGSSFTCAYISAIVAEILMDGFHGMADVLKQLKIRAKDIRGFSDSGRKGRPMPIIKKAVLFPFNKEMHAIALFQDMLNFTIIDIYDSAKSGRVGATVSKIMHTGESEIIKDFIIKDIRNVDMSQFDTMILGHTSDLQQLLGDSSIIDDLLRRLSINNKQVFAFDNLTDRNPSVWSCRIDSNSLPQNRFGKLFQITKPVLGVVGTSSKQGKFTLQLLLRRRFLKDGYRVGQMGTEPSSLLFGMDEVFPCGYNTSIYISNEDILLYLNTKMWEISQKNYDIIITGSQASVLSYATYNTRTYPLVHQQYLQAVAPDALIICVNPFDELHFVRSNIYAAEALSKGRVIAAVCFPLKMKDDWSGALGTREFLSDSEINTLKKLYNEKMQLPLYVLGVESEMDDLYQDCVAFFINS